MYLLFEEQNMMNFRWLKAEDVRQTPLGYGWIFVFKWILFGNTKAPSKHPPPFQYPCQSIDFARQYPEDNPFR